MAESELAQLQLPTGGPLPTQVDAETNLLLVPMTMTQRMRHFPEEVYDTTAESHLARFVHVLLGDAGAGQLRKALLRSRLQQTINGTHFYALDKFYGALFDFRRSINELLSVNPQNEMTNDWQAEHRKDASYRSRIQQFARAITHGATPTGMELVAEAVFAVDCDVYESYIQADANHRTYAEIEADYVDYLGMEGESYASLEGEGLPVLAGNERRVFTVRPKREITMAESYDLLRVLNKLKPADARVEIDWHGVTTTVPLSLNGIASDSEYWEVVSLVPDPNGPPVEPPGPPFSKHQGEKWTYNGDVLGTAAFSLAPSPSYEFHPYMTPGTTGGSSGYYHPGVTTVGGRHFAYISDQPRASEILRRGGVLYYQPTIGNFVSNANVALVNGTYGTPLYQEYVGSLNPVPVISPVQRIRFGDGSHQDYPPADTILPLMSILAGRIVSDGILVSGPYGGYRPNLVQTITTASGTYTYDWTAFFRAFVYLLIDFIPMELVLLWMRDNVVDPMEFTASRRFWVSPARHQADTTAEYVEVTLNEAKLINHVVFETSRYPHVASVEYFDTVAGAWATAYIRPTSDSLPAFHGQHSRAIAVHSAYGKSAGHYEHPHSVTGHWVQHDVKFSRVTTDRIRIKLVRGPGTPPYEYLPWGRHYNQVQVPIPYSLAVRKATVGYRIDSYDDLLPFKNPDPIAKATNFVGQAIRFAGRHQAADGLLLNPQEAWRSEPQPFNYAVVNLFLDTRDGEGEPSTIDRFYLNPTHPGCHITIYWSLYDDGEPDYEAEDGGASFFEDVTWYPLPRDYVAQKGYIHLPPTRARWFKFEFTNLVAEPYEVFVPIKRNVRIFPVSVVEATKQIASGVGNEGRPAGVSAAITQEPAYTYSDAVEVLAAESQTFKEDSPTSAFYVRDPNGHMTLREQSWTYGFQPYTQGNSAPRFSRFDRHVYQEVELYHTGKVGYFCGLTELVVYRLDFDADDDTEIYTDDFDDFLNLEPGFTWTFNPGGLTSGEDDSVETTSRVMHSLHNVRAVQFATSQSDPVQMIADDEFQDPILGESDWSDTDEWHKTGDATLLYNANETTVTIVRYAETPTTAIVHTPGLPQPIPKPVLAELELTVEDEEAALLTWGGIESGLHIHSVAGRVHAAARVVVETELTSPLVLQIMDDDDNVLAEKSMTGRSGERLEWYVGWSIPDPTPASQAIRVRLIQEGKSDDRWRVDTLSLFDDGVVWEFSVNGGSDWYPAFDIRNNVYGILTFPAPGNALVYRVRGVRPHVSVSGIRIRPHYLGVHNARQQGTHRGPNVSTFDHDPPIQLDPWWTQWSKPIPRSWFYAYRGLPQLPVAGAANPTQFARYYARPAEDNIAGLTDEVTVAVTQGRGGLEELGFFAPVSDSASRSGSTFFRTAGDSAPATDELVHSIVPDEGTVVDVPVHLLGEEYEEPEGGPYYMTIVTHGPTEDAMFDWEIEFDPTLLDIDDPRQGWVINPDDGNTLALTPAGPDLLSILDYTALAGYDLEDIGTLLGIPGLASGDILVTHDSGATFELLYSDAINITSGEAVVEPPFIPDPDSGTFETNLGSWITRAGFTTTDLARSNDQARTGSWSARLTSTVDTAADGGMFMELPRPDTDPDPVPWNPGDFGTQVKIRTWLRTASPHVTGYLVTALWFDEDFVQVPGAGASESIPTVLVDTWQRSQIYDNAPPTAAYLYMQVYAYCDGSTPAGETVYVDDVQTKTNL